MQFYVTVLATVYTYVKWVAWTEELAIGTERINVGSILIEESTSSGHQFFFF